MATFNKPRGLTLYPRTLSWSTDAARDRIEIARLPPVLRARVLANRVVGEARLERERPFRVANQRARLAACHWAGWRPERASTRWGDVGPKWLGVR